jgi:hypothetical protein
VSCAEPGGCASSSEPTDKRLIGRSNTAVTMTAKITATRDAGRMRGSTGTRGHSAMIGGRGHPIGPVQ